MKYLSLIFIFFNTLLFSQPNQGCKAVFSRNMHHNELKREVKRSGNILMNNYDVCFYNIDLNASNKSTDISGFVQMKAKTKVSNFSKVVLDLSNSFIIDSVKINGFKTTYELVNDELAINISSPLNKDTYFETYVYYHGAGSEGQSFPAGMSNGVGNSKSYTYTVSEPYHSYLWWPCKQVLEDKADSVYINITTEKTNLVASNGLLKNSKDLNNGKKRFEWKTYYPIAYYLITFATGPYIEYKTYANPKGATKPILIQNFLYDQNDLNRFKSEIDKTASLIELFSEKYGMYPFSNEKYGHYSAPTNLGALENQTMTMMNTYNYSLIAHELTHQWFGDNVTCGTWSDIWLNEGFAEYSENCIAGNSSNISYLQNEVLNVPSSKAYITNTSDPYQIFNHTNSYAKGATILHMLRFELGKDSLFFDLLQKYQVKYTGKTVVTDTFASFVSNYTKKDYTYFFNQWIKGSGHPIYTFSYYQKGDTVYLTSNQATSSTTGLFKMKLDFLVNFNEGGTQTVEFYQSNNKEIFKIYIPGKTVSSLKANPNNWSLMKANSSIPVISGENNFLSFDLIPNAISTSIVGDKITIVVPYSTNLKLLKAVFQASNLAKVSIGQVAQVSGVNINDFSSTLIYTVTAENGNTKNYLVSVIKDNPVQNRGFLTYEFASVVDSVILNDSIIKVFVPAKTDLTKLIANFSVQTDAFVSLKGIKQDSGITVNDFTTELNYVISVLNGEPKTVKVIVQKLKDAGLFELKSSTIIYPNPTNGSIKVKGEPGEISLNIHDQAGKLIYNYFSKTYQGETLSIDLNVDLTSLFFIQLVNNGEEVIRKIDVLK